MEDIIKERKKTRKGFQDEDWPEKYLEKVACPLCKNKNFRKLYSDSYRRIVICDNCKLIYTNPRLKRKYLKHLYSKEYFQNTNSSHFGYENYLADEEKIVKTFSKRMKEIEHIVGKKSGRILDVGCATGFFLKAAQNRGWKTEGVEISNFAAKYAREHFGFKVYASDFLNLKINGKFDVITMWDVIEHFYDPAAALSFANKLLNKGGILVMSTPDVSSLPAKLTRDKWVGYKLSDEHLTYFSIYTIKKLLKKTGFTFVKGGHVGKHVSLDMLSNRASLYHPYLGKLISIAKVIFPHNYFLYVNPFDIMCVYARKKST